MERQRPHYCTGRARRDFSIQRRCPRCDGWLPIGYPGALSRYDNKTEICSDCGVVEALTVYNENKEKIGAKRDQKDNNGSSEEA